VAITFYAFRIMVGLGVMMLILVAAGVWLRFRGRLFESRWYLHALEYSAPIGFFALLAGWTVTEVGRQPWTVYGLLRTSDSVSPSLTGGDVLTSLILYVVVYLLVFPVGLYFMTHIVHRGPVAPEPAPIEAGRPRQPVEELPAARPQAGAEGTS
jgi:cytochrome d ubiquinol oxidase subunit I